MSNVNDYIWDEPNSAFEVRSDRLPYEEVPECSEAIRKYTADPSKFCLNSYAGILDTARPEHPPTNADGLSYRSARYCFPFQVTPNPPAAVLSEHGAIPACKAMCVRSILAFGLLSAEKCHTNPVRRCKGTGLDEIKEALTELKASLKESRISEDGIRLVASPACARLRFLGEHPKKETSVSGVRLVPENTVRVEGESRRYEWPDDIAALVYQDPEPNAFRFDSLQFRFYERMVVEVGGAPGEARVVEDYEVVFACPQLTYLFKW